MSLSARREADGPERMVLWELPFFPGGFKVNGLVVLGMEPIQSKDGVSLHWK